MPVSVEADGIGRYPQDIEAAVYFCVLEALQNIQKYAQASHVVVSVRQEDGSIAFAVVDDGSGFDVASMKRGAGLTNMADRLDALGGELQITSSPGEGTTITGSLGVTTPEAAEVAPPSSGGEKSTMRSRKAHGESTIMRGQVT